MLSQLTGGGKFRRVNLTGAGIESVVTNTCYLAEVLEKATCTTKEKIERVLEDEVKGASWEQDMKGSEQHMKEEEEVRLDWSNGKFGKNNMQCTTCGDTNVWDRTHACCQDECKKVLNALQTFPTGSVGRYKLGATGPREGYSSKKAGNSLCR